MYSKYLKRMLDILFSFIALVFLSPLMILLAALVRVAIGAPVIFVQERPGKNERIFKLHKFRTMTNETDADGKLLPDSERLTSLGRLLRRLSLDELPELWDILLGHMSFIGPRPLLISYLPYYNDAERIRHQVRPGLTGLAQIIGRNFLSWDERFASDIEYVNNLSFSNDWTIFWKTVALMFSFGKGVNTDNLYKFGDFDEYRRKQTCIGGEKS